MSIEMNPQYCIDCGETLKYREIKRYNPYTGREQNNTVFLECPVSKNHLSYQWMEGHDEEGGLLRTEVRHVPGLWLPLDK